MALTRDAVVDALKEMYEDNADTEMVLKDHPLLTMAKRKKDMSGRYFHFPVKYGKPQGRSHSMTTAATNEYASKWDGFDVTPVSDYVVAKIAGIVVRQSMKDGNANMFLDLLKDEMDGSLSTLGDNQGKEMYGSAGGWRARVHPTTAISTTSLTLANPEDSFFFEAGMKVAASDTDGTSGSLRDSGNTNLLTAVNRDSGILVGTSNWSSAISGVTNNDYLFAAGDFGAAGSGLQTWVPSSATSMTDLFGVTRSNDPERLGGIRYDGSSDTQETVYIRAMARSKRTKARIKYIFTNPINTSNLEISKEGAKFITTDNEYKIGITGFRYGSVEIIEDNDCPVNQAWAIDPSAWYWCTNGEAPSLQEADGVEFLRMGAASGDFFELQGVVDYNFGSPAPGKIMRITLPAAA